MKNQSIPEKKIPDLMEIGQETWIEKVFRMLAILLIIICPIALFLCFRVVNQYKRAIILRFGRVRDDSPAGPGIIWVVPCTDNVLLVDLRTQSFNLPAQEILTKDSVTVTVGAVMYFHVLKPLNCIMNVQSHNLATELIAVAALRNILGRYTLSDLLTRRETISVTSRNEIDKVTSEWGVAMERVEIKDVMLPYELQKAMAAEAEGTRIAKAKIIESQGEIKAAENLREASRMIMENPQILLLRYLQSLSFLAAQQNSTIFFPFPIEMPEPRENNILLMHGSKENLNETKPQEEGPNTNSDPEKGTTNSGIEENLPKGLRIPDNIGQDKVIEKVLVFFSILTAVVFFPFSLFFIFVVVRQFERVIILRNGKVHQNHGFGPGLVCYLPCVDTIKYVDLRTYAYAVPPQEALTKDSLTVSVDAVVFYKVSDPVAAVINVAEYQISTHFLAATALRNALGTRKLGELLSDRPAVSFQVFQLIKRVTRDWGIKVARVEIKDISLPLQLQKAMAAEAESSRLANAKIIVAKAEIESTRNLQQATIMLMDNPYCMQLRYLQSLHTIACEKTNTIVFPFCVNLLRKIFK